MAKEIWINLPVKDLKKSKEFFKKLGFSFNTQYSNEDEAISLVVGNKNVIVMLFPDATFEGFAGNKITDTKQSTEVLLSMDVDSKEEVDEMLRKAVEAGGTSFYEPEEHGGMYGCGFADLDGHRWNVLYMDINNI